MKSVAQNYQNRWEASLQSNYGIPNLTLISGKGSTVTDSEGKEYLDLLGGIATNILGHAHPEIVKSVTNQISKLGHVSNFFIHPGVIVLAEKLQSLTGDSRSRVFFCNSGTEANEAALKLSRKTGRKRIVATTGAFHGRTMGSLSLTGQSAKRDPFKPLLPGISHVTFGDLEAMKRKTNRKTAMVILEPIMGEAGVIMPPAGYLKGIRELCDQTGALMVLDCVQTGMGRTGEWFGYEYEGISPDVITLAKGLGGGLPLGAMIALGAASHLFEPGDHGSTFGGNPVACASALAAIKVIEQKSLLIKAKAHGAVINSELSEQPQIVEVRGQGLLLGIVLAEANSALVRDSLLSAGIIVNAPSPNVIRIAPALTITRKEVAKFISIFIKVVQGVSHG